jgi:hypothetical protein
MSDKFEPTADTTGSAPVSPPDQYIELEFPVGRAEVQGILPLTGYPEVILPLGRTAMQGTVDYDPRNVLKVNLELLKTFCLKYLVAEGIGLALILAVAQSINIKAVDIDDLTEEASMLPAMTVEEALLSFLNVDALEESDIFDLDRLIEGAPSFALIVRYAHKLDPMVMPPERIPSDEVVNAALTLFHALPRSIDPVPPVDDETPIDPEATQDLRNN